MEGEIIREGDRVLLYLNERRQYLVRMEAGRDFHTHRGYIKLNDAIGRRFGEAVKSSMNADFVLLPPLLSDYVARFARRTQVLYPKDIGLIIAYGSISSGSRVIEAGTGSGALTCILASIVRPNGHVYSYEVNEEFRQTAEENLKTVGVADYATLKLKDVALGFDESNVDAIILDLGSPWLVVPEAKKALKPGGVLISFSPTVNQIQRTLESMHREGFVWSEVLEAVLRRWQAAEDKLRPETLMIGHTGFLCLGRKAG